MTPQFSRNMRECLLKGDSLRQDYHCDRSRPSWVNLTLEKVLHHTGLEMEIVEDPLLGPSMEHQDARLEIENGVLKIWRPIYDGSDKGNAADCFTMAHELGHVVMHFPTMSISKKLGRGRPGKGTSFAYNPIQELEANEFAGSFLVPLEAIDCTTKAADLVSRYPVSFPAAEAILIRARAAFPTKWRLGR